MAACRELGDNDLSPLSPARDCGHCTACCDGWLKIVIDGETVEPGKKCRFSSGQGCTNYDHRPIDPCRKFICGWLAQKSPLPEWMRPDKAKLIFLPRFFYWREQPVDVAVPVSTGIESEAINWIKGFALTQRRLLMYQVESDWYALGPLAFQEEMSARIGQSDNIWSPQAFRP